MGNLSWDPSTHKQAGHDPLHACNLSTVGTERREMPWRNKDEGETGRHLIPSSSVHACTYTPTYTHAHNTWCRKGCRTSQGRHKLRQDMTTHLALQKALTGILYTEEKGRDSVMKGQEWKSWEEWPRKGELERNPTQETGKLPTLTDTVKNK